MARSAIFRKLRQLLHAADVARRTGQRPEEVLAAARASRGPRRRDLLVGALGGAALVPLASACGDDLGAGEAGGDGVAIIGGGIAGLHCAYRLAAAGVPATVFEASPRAGGRMFTARGMFPDDQICELGGELVDTDHTTIQTLAAELGLQLDDLPAATAGLRPDTFHFDGMVASDAEIVDAFTPLAAQMSATVTAAEADDAEFARVDAMSISGWLGGEAGLPTTSLIRRILEVAYTGEYGLEADDQSIFNVLYLIDSSTPDPFRIFGDSDERFHVHQGSEAIPAALAAALGERVVLEHALVAAAARDDGRYDLTFETPDGDRTITAAHVVFALPFTRLRAVDLDGAGLPADKRDVIANLGYGTNAKLMLGFGSRRWAEPGGASGSCFSDVGQLQSTWDTSRGQGGAHGILTNFVGGDRGVAIGDGSAEERAAEVVPWIDTVFPGSAAVYRAGSAVRMHWPSQPFTLGSYASYRVGQWAYFGTEGQRVGNLHFCGEHTSQDYQGYMEGGAETGALVALEILDDLGVAATERHRAIVAPKLAAPQATYHAPPPLRRNRRRAMRSAAR